MIKTRKEILKKCCGKGGPTSVPSVLSKLPKPITAKPLVALPKPMGENKMKPTVSPIHGYGKPGFMGRGPMHRPLKFNFPGKKPFPKIMPSTSPQKSILKDKVSAVLK